jgi:hypothetical protein
MKRRGFLEAATALPFLGSLLASPAQAAPNAYAVAAHSTRDVVARFYFYIEIISGWSSWAAATSIRESPTLQIHS